MLAVYERLRTGQGFWIVGDTGGVGWSKAYLQLTRTTCLKKKKKKEKENTNQKKMKKNKKEAKTGSAVLP
jgi:hypothetical protein